MSALPSEDQTVLPATLLDDVAAAPTRLDVPPSAAAGRAEAVGADATVFVDDRVARLRGRRPGRHRPRRRRGGHPARPRRAGPPGASAGPDDGRRHGGVGQPAPCQFRRRGRAGGSPAQRPLRPRGGGRPGRHGHGPRRPRPRAPPPGGAQGAVPRGGARPVGPLALRARGAGDRAARSPAHRPGLRPRGRVGRTAGLRDEAGRGPDVRAADRRHARASTRRRTPPDEDHALPARLEHFLKVCDAVAYAHERGRRPSRPQAGQPHGGPAQRGLRDGLGHLPPDGPAGRARPRPRPAAGATSEPRAPPGPAPSAAPRSAPRRATTRRRTAPSSGRRSTCRRNRRTDATTSSTPRATSARSA